MRQIAEEVKLGLTVDNTVAGWIVDDFSLEWSTGNFNVGWTIEDVGEDGPVKALTEMDR